MSGPQVLRYLDSIIKFTTYNLMGLNVSQNNRMEAIRLRRTEAS